MLFIIFKVQMISTQQVVQFHCLQIIRIYKQLTDPMDSMADPLFSSYSVHIYLFSDIVWVMKHPAVVAWQ